MQHWALMTLKEARYIILQTVTDDVVWEMSIEVLGKFPLSSPLYDKAAK